MDEIAGLLFRPHFGSFVFKDGDQGASLRLMRFCLAGFPRLERLDDAVELCAHIRPDLLCRCHLIQGADQGFLRRRHRAAFAFSCFLRVFREPHFLHGVFSKCCSVLTNSFGVY
jgi:hypothetical protein